MTAAVQEVAGLPDMSLGMTVPRLMLAATILLFGFFPRLVIDTINVSVIPLVEMFK